MTESVDDAGVRPASLVEATSAAGAGIRVPPARAVGRAFPLGDDGAFDRVLLAVAEGIGDPPSAEAQAAEALGRLEATVSRSSETAAPAAVLEASFVAADEAVERLLRLPGSVPGSGAALLAALVEDDAVTLANVGRGAAYLVRGGAVQRLTRDQRWPIAGGERAQSGGPQPLGSGGGVAPEVLSGPRMTSGDLLLLCSEAVARRLGERVIAAVTEEFPAEQVAQQLTDLATREAGAEGAAVALFHVPGDEPAGASVAPSPALTGAGRWLLPAVVVAGAIAVGILVTLAIVFARSRGGGGSQAAKTSASVTAPVSAFSAVASPAVTRAPAFGSPTSVLGRGTPSPSASAKPGGAGTTARPVATASPGPLTTPGAGSTPAAAAALAVCDSSGRTPCRYTAKPGDSVSAIGDQFTLTRACFEAANRTHQPAPPQPPADVIGAGEEYVIPDSATCLALAAAAPVAGSATPAAACTPRPGASAPPPGC
ncbi:MAG: PP2C family protein-serine/threonine phosphatase [Dehalococcoidia bacterium]